MRADKTKRLFWLALTIVAACFSASVVLRNGWHAFRTARAVRMLEREQEAYRERIEQDSALLEQLEYDEYLERYAREHYRMQRPGEHVYIFPEE